MIRKLTVLAAVMFLASALSCSNISSPAVPDKINADNPNDYFNTFDLTSPVVANYKFTDFGGNVIAAGKLGRGDDGLYIIESRGAEIDIDITPLGFVDIWVEFNNPLGIVGSGPNAGLPYYHSGIIMDYDINLRNHMWTNIGGWPYSGPAELVAEQRQAYWNDDGEVVVGDLLGGEPIFNWEGILPPGYSEINDKYLITPPLTQLDVITCRLTAPIVFGFFDIVFYDGIAGMWDPPGKAE